MSFYQDIILYPDAEIPTPVLFNEVFTNFHKGVVNFGVGTIAVSFPDLGESFGKTLRLHGTMGDLDAFGVGWLGSSRRRVSCKEVQAVPQDAALGVYSRRRKKTYGPSWRRRYERRHGVAPNIKRPHQKGPVLFIHSTSTGEVVPINVTLKRAARGCRPNSYGFGALVPLF